MTRIGRSLGMLLFLCGVASAKLGDPTVRAVCRVKLASGQSIVMMRGRLSESEAKRLLARHARDILLAIKNLNGARLAPFVHPSKGVRLGGLVFTRDQIRNIFSNKRRYLWGYEDGSANPIRLTARQYVKRWVYNRDFLRVKEIGYNKIILGGDVTTDIPEAYPGATAVTYYFPGPYSDTPGFGWQSLCLIFEHKNRTWYLTGVVTFVQTI